MDNFFFSDILVPAKGNNGFNVIIFEETKEQEPRTIALAIECQFSQPDARSLLSMEEIHKKWDLTQKAFTASKGLPNLKPNRDIYLIIAAWRDLQKDV